MDHAVSDVSGVIHLAGLAHVQGLRHSDQFYSVNTQMTEKLAEAAKKRSAIRLFIHMSSLAAITDNVSNQTIDDTTPPRPATDYGISKLQAEAHTAQLSAYGVCAVSLRPPLIVGPGAKGNWASLQKLAATGLPLPFRSIHNRRSLVSVQTVIQAIRHLCCEIPVAEKSGNYCIADPEALSLRSILTELRTGFGMSPRLLPFPSSALAIMGRLAGRQRLAASLLEDLIVDSSRFYSVFEFVPTISLREAIRRSGSDYRALRSGRSPDFEEQASEAAI